MSDPAQMVLRYQPMADMVTGQVSGVEALVRWQHPTDGLLLPHEFLPLAERTGLIGPMTDLVLDTALRQVKEWNEQGLELGVSVNISMRCLHDEGLAERVQRCLRRHGVPASRLEIDRSFVTDMNPGSTDAALVRTCIELARNLGLTVVAEGIETATVWNQLIQLGCHQAQGYFLARPMPAHEVREWIVERDSRADTGVDASR